MRRLAQRGMQMENPDLLARILSNWIAVASGLLGIVATAATTYFLIYDRVAKAGKEEAERKVATERERDFASGRVLGSRTPFIAVRTSNGAACVIKVEMEVERYSRASDGLKEFEVRPKALEILAPYVSEAVRAYTSEFALPNSERAARQRDEIISRVVPASDREFKDNGLHLSSLKLGAIICTKDLL